MARTDKVIGTLPSILAMGLHVVTFFRAEGGPSTFSVGLLLWSWLPYIFCLAAAFAFRSPWPAFVAASLAFTLDLITFDAVFIHPYHSTAAIDLLFVPLVNLVVVPVGLLLGWGASRLFRTRVAP